MIRCRRQQPVRESLQALFLSHACAGPALRPERPVEVFHCDLGLRFFNLRPKFRSQLSLRLNALQHLFLFLFEIAQIGQSLVQCTQLLIVQCARRLFPVPGNKRNCVSLIDQ